MSNRFVDTLVRCTVIEYEPDLRNDRRFESGYGQLKDYVSGVVRAGANISQVRAVLSDTVEWHTYDAQLTGSARPETCTAADVELSETEELRLSVSNEAAAYRFCEFMRKHLARQQSRLLTATSVVLDLGLESPAYGRHRNILLDLVNDARATDASMRLATNLWCEFVDYLESHTGQFRTEAYVHEAYLALLARLLCVNVLERRARLSPDDELAQILTGEYTRDKFLLQNLVEEDYFAWLWRDPHIGHVLPLAREVQRDLYAYDFTSRASEDLFGRLMAQLARHTQRKLLGLAPTPQWVARLLAEKCLAMIPARDLPRVVDICCGSGLILAEVLKAVRQGRPQLSFTDLRQVATGFDIDPLAVLLAKTTWVVTLADDVRQAAHTITIPIYHADSLFAVTPITGRLPLPEQSGVVEVDLDGHVIAIPSELIGPELSLLFEGVVEWAYDEARHAKEIGDTRAITADRARQFVQEFVRNHRLTLTRELRGRVEGCAHQIATRMADLAVADRNGIWAFVLRNTYRPGLLAGQFNALVSNPPWLSMSQFADNPYREQLSLRAQAYGIKPGGAAHLHLELATTHLLHAVDRYLGAGAAITCLTPGTILNGQHHAKFRDAAYLTAGRSVPFELQEIWSVAPDTFKVRAAVAVGVKRRTVRTVRRSPPRGALASPDGIQPCRLEVRRLGRRTAWVICGSVSSTNRGTADVPDQGADLMPRPAVCIEVRDRRGPEWQVRTPRRRDDTYFAVCGAKRLRGRTFDGFVGETFIHVMVQSLNLLPFALDNNFVQVAIPARRDCHGRWEIMDPPAIRAAGYLETARRFNRIDRAMERDDIVKPLHEKVNERNKLAIQRFPSNRYLVLNGAGGGVACAACIALSTVPRIVVDQTLYWTLVRTQAEAWYRVGLTNTDALTDAISEFNPQGLLGPRHLHTLPNRVIPPFDPDNNDHVRVGILAERLSRRAQILISTNDFLSDPTRPIAARRRRLRDLLMAFPEYAQVEAASSAVLGLVP